MKSKLIIYTLLAVFLSSLIGVPTRAGDKKEAKAKLETKAKITKATAQKTALEKVPNGKVKEAELEEEKGKLIWSFDIATPGTKDITEVQVDAITGAVVSVEKETAAEEKAEKKAEKKEKKEKKKD